MERFNQEDNFFKKLKPERESFSESDSRIIKTIEDQESLSIKGDFSSEDYIDELNNQIKTREIIGKDGKVVAEESWEEEKRDAELGEKIEALRLKYVKLREEIKERQIILDELRDSKSGAERAAKKLNWKELTSRERNSVVTDMMRNAEDRIGRLKNKIEKNQIELTPLILEFGEIQEAMESLSELVNVHMTNERGELENEGYKFNLN